MSPMKPATSSQPEQALQFANRVRRARSVLKARVADGQVAAAEVILNHPPEAASMPVVQLLASQRGWGMLAPARFSRRSPCERIGRSGR